MVESMSFRTDIRQTSCKLTATQVRLLSRQCLGCEVPIQAVAERKLKMPNKLMGQTHGASTARAFTSQLWREIMHMGVKV